VLDELQGLGEQYNVEKDQVLLLQERVGEAQREAIHKMKEVHEKRGHGGARAKTKSGKNVWGVKGGKIEKNRDDIDREEL
jgi:ATP-dependent RNA helicase DDX47/RRP3